MVRLALRAGSATGQAVWQGGRSDPVVVTGLEPDLAELVRAHFEDDFPFESTGAPVGAFDGIDFVQRNPRESRNLFGYRASTMIRGREYDEFVLLDYDASVGLRPEPDAG